MMNASKSNSSSNNNNKKRPAEEPQEEETRPPTKRPRTVNKRHYHHLSKFATRLLQQPRSAVIEPPPPVIPQNDEFLQAFGQREKAFDEARGKALETIQDDDNDSDNDNEEFPSSSALQDSAATSPAATRANKGFKVKIFNLKYTTSYSTLERTCTAFGNVLRLNLIMEDDQEDDDDNVTNLGATKNKGRAFVTFETEEAAQACVSSLTTLDGRPLRLELGNTDSSKNSNKSSHNKNESRYFVRRKEHNISFKCFRCGGTGHVEAECTNEPQARPCPLCADTVTHSEPRACPIKAVCFNCGIPGHVSRYCTQPRGYHNNNNNSRHYLQQQQQQQRTLCTTCGTMGHDKYSCPTWQQQPQGHAQQYLRQQQNLLLVQEPQALCMVCGTLGHYCCRPVKFESGWNGLTCGNCGLAGHVSQQCRRTRLDQLIRDPELAVQEILRTSEMVKQQHQAPPPQARGRAPHRSNSSNNNNNNNNSNNRAKSAPPKYRRAHSMPDRYDHPAAATTTMPPRHERHERRQYSNDTTSRGYRGRQG